MKLNIGSGYKRFEGFLNVDGDRLVLPDILMNIETDPFPLPDSSVDEVKCHHILEHVGEGFFHFMQEIYRVSSHGAILDIQVPHHRHEIFYGDCSHVRAITVENMRQFSKTYNQFHIGAFNSSSGFGLRLSVDFEIVEFNFVPDDIWKQRFPTMTQEQIEEVSRNFNNVYGETHIKMMVRKDG